MTRSGPSLGQEATALLALADTVAAGLIRSAGPVRFRVAAGEDERDAIFRLRYRTVVENAWAPAASMPDGRERDAFDEDAVHVGGWDGNLLVACARVVFPSEGRRLPTEQEFDVEVTPAGSVVDVGRGIVVPGHRDEDRRVFTALLGTCWLELRRGGYWRMAGDAAPWLLEVYRDMGFQVEVLGAGRTFWGAYRVPIVIDGLASVRSFLARRTSAI